MRICLHSKFYGQVYENSPLNFFIIKDDLTWINMEDHRLIVLYEENVLHNSLFTYIHIQIYLYQGSFLSKSLEVSVQSLRVQYFCSNHKSSKWNRSDQVWVFGNYLSGKYSPSFGLFLHILFHHHHKMNWNCSMGSEWNRSIRTSKATWNPLPMIQGQKSLDSQQFSRYSPGVLNKNCVHTTVS